MLTVTVCYRETLQIKISYGKKHKVHEKYHLQSFCFPLPVKSGCVTLRVPMCDNMHRALPIGNLSWGSVFILHRLGPHGWSLSPGQLILHDKSPTLSHIVGLSSVARLHPGTIWVASPMLNHFVRLFGMTQNSQANTPIRHNVSGGLRLLPRS